MKVNKFVQALIPYSSKQADVSIRLNANETNNYLFESGISYQYDVERYPGVSNNILSEQIASWQTIKPTNVILGNGSTELLEMCVKTFSEIGDNLLTVTPSFSMYDVYAQMHGRHLKKVPLKNDGVFPVEEFVKTMTQLDPSIIFLCTPNNPTGTSIPKEDMLLILRQTDALVIVDEAYIEFSDNESMISYINEYPNLLIARTFSKAFGMASARLGYMVGNEKTIRILSKVKLPYSLNEVSARMGIDALQDLNKLNQFIYRVKEERQKVYTVLLSLGIDTLPSNTNFLYVRTNINLQKRLLQYGILIRSLGKRSYRITIGTPHENKQLISALQEVYNEN